MRLDVVGCDKIRRSIMEPLGKTCCPCRAVVQSHMMAMRNESDNSGVSV